MASVDIVALVEVNQFLFGQAASLILHLVQIVLHLIYQNVELCRAFGVNHYLGFICMQLLIIIGGDLEIFGLLVNAVRKHFFFVELLIVGLALLGDDVVVLLGQSV